MRQIQIEPDIYHIRESIIDHIRKHGEVFDSIITASISKLSDKEKQLLFIMAKYVTTASPYILEALNKGKPFTLLQGEVKRIGAVYVSVFNASPPPLLQVLEVSGAVAELYYRTARGRVDTELRVPPHITPLVRNPEKFMTISTPEANLEEFIKVLFNDALEQQLLVSHLLKDSVIPEAELREKVKCFVKHPRFRQVEHIIGRHGDIYGLSPAAKERLPALLRKEEEKRLHTLVTSLGFDLEALTEQDHPYRYVRKLEYDPDLGGLTGAVETRSRGSAWILVTCWINPDQQEWIETVDSAVVISIQPALSLKNYSEILPEDAAITFLAVEGAEIHPIQVSHKFIKDWLHKKAGKGNINGRTQLPQRSQEQTSPPQTAEPLEEERRVREIELPSIYSTEFAILLGRSVSDGRPVRWYPFREKNCNVLIVGTAGSGKTQTVKALIHEFTSLGIPSLILDYHAEYTKEAGFADVELEIDLRRGDVGINPLELAGRQPIDVTYQVSGVLRRIFGLGDQQEARLIEAIKMAYEEAGIEKPEDEKTGENPTLLHVRKQLLAMAEGGSKETRRIVEQLLNRLRPIFDLNLFAKPTTIPFSQITSKNTAIILKNLPGEKVQAAASDFFLRWLWRHTTQRGIAQLRQICVIDEGHRLAYKDTPLTKILREARKFGIGVILSSQRPTDFNPDIAANISTYIALQLPYKQDAEWAAKQIDCKPQQIQNLTKRGQAITRFLSEETHHHIQITPYTKRTKQ